MKHTVFCDLHQFTLIFEAYMFCIMEYRCQVVKKSYTLMSMTGVSLVSYAFSASLCVDT